MAERYHNGAFEPCVVKQYHVSKTIELTDTLPITINADGNALLDYRIYGASGGVGDRTENLYDQNATDTANGYIYNAYLKSSGNTATAGRTYIVTEYIPVVPGSTYTISRYGDTSVNDPSLCFYDSNHDYVSGVAYNGNRIISVEVPINAEYLRFSVFNNYKSNTMLVKGSTAPAEYVPYGYEVDMGVRSANLFDKNATDPSKGYAVNGYIDANGNVQIANGYRVSEYMTVQADQTYYLKDLVTTGSSCNAAFYDANKGFISATSVYNVASLTTPPNAAYMRISFYSTLKDKTMVSAAEIIKYQPYSNTTVPIYIGDEPLGEGEYVDYSEQKVYKRTAQVMPSAPAETKILNGVTVTCDGEGQYNISGTATSDTQIKFNLDEFTVPVSVGQGGHGTLSFFNDFTNPTVSLSFYYDNTLVDTWEMFDLMRDSTAYSTMGGEKVNAVSIYVPSNVTMDGVISPMFTDNGTLPETYIPYLQPTDPPVPLPEIPTADGTTIIDYDGTPKPSQMYIKYNSWSGWEDCTEYVRRNGVWVQQTAPAQSQQSLPPQMSLDVQPIQSPSQTMGVDEPIALETDVTDNNGGGEI